MTEQTEQINTTHDYDRLWSMLPQTLPTQPPFENSQIDVLAHPPSNRSLYMKALKRRSGLNRDDSVPNIAAQTELTVSTSWLHQYAQICGWTPSDDTPIIPLTAPQVLAAPLHMYLLTHRRFPASTLGVVHASNEMIALRSLNPAQSLKTTAWIGETRWKARGFEVDMFTVITQEDGEPRWLGKTTVFRSVKTPQSTSSKTAKEDLIISEPAHELNLPADQGRRYAPIAGDYNPIHLYPITARLFGFKRPIVHGMWTLAHLLSQSCSEISSTSVGTLSVHFRRPLSLPLTTQSLSYQSAQGVLMQALDHRGKLAVNAAFSPHLPTKI